MTNWTEHTTHANGIDIHYWRTGGEKPAMLCLHGLTDSGRCWSLLASQLEAEYDLIMPDARGHGRSSVPEQGYRTEDRAADALALLDALALDQVVVIGHSMGGDSGAMLSARAPERVRAAILEDPSFRLPGNEHQPHVIDEWTVQMLADKQKSLEQLVAQGRANMSTWDPRVLEPWAEAKLQVDPHVYDWLRGPRTPWAEYVAAIRVPTLVITAEPQRGAIITPEIAAMLAELSPHIRVERISGAGHCVRYEQPEAFVQAVRGFLGE